MNQVIETVIIMRMIRKKRDDQPEMIWKMKIFEKMMNNEILERIENDEVNHENQVEISENEIEYEWMIVNE
jgi:hypothetical protein